MLAWARSLAPEFKRGETILLYGDLGAGKTTWVRGFMQGLGLNDPVRSPTFNLIQTFSTLPPVMHADLYRVTNALGIGLEDYFDSHLCLIEWPDRLEGLVDQEACWRLFIDFFDAGRKVSLVPPTSE